MNLPMSVVTEALPVDQLDTASKIASRAGPVLIFVLISIGMSSDCILVFNFYF